MQIDMHFYGIYALARAAGVKPDTAFRIAYASQFVDDAMENDYLLAPGGSSAILPVVTSHKPTDFENAIPRDQWEVWVPFHFLPGNDPVTGTFMERMVCQKGSSPARQMLDDTLKQRTEPFGPHLAGIAAHVYADTYAHYGFVGLCTDFNKVRAGSIQVSTQSLSMKEYLEAKYQSFMAQAAGTVAETLPLGHGAVATFPDRPFLNWQYRYEDRALGPVNRNNPDDFLKASEELHTFFGRFVAGNPLHGDSSKPVAWSAIAGRVEQIIKTEAHLDERVDLWRKSIGQGELFEAVDEDRYIRYSERLWKLNAVLCDPACGNSPACSDPCLFTRAARMYRDYVRNELLSKNGLVVI